MELVSGKEAATRVEAPPPATLSTSLLAVYGASLHMRDFQHLSELAADDHRRRRVTLSRADAARLLKPGLADVAEDGSLRITRLGQDLIGFYNRINHDGRL